MERKNIAIGIASAVYGLAFFVMAFSIKDTKSSTASPSLFPKIVSFLLVVLGLILILREFVRSRHSAQAERTPTRVANLGMILRFSVLMVLYLALMNVLGFTLMTFLFLFCGLHMLEPGRDKKLLVKQVVFAAVFTAILFLAFAIFFNATLPVGMIFGG